MQGFGNVLLQVEGSWARFCLLGSRYELACYGSEKELMRLPTWDSAQEQRSRQAVPSRTGPAVVEECIFVIDRRRPVDDTGF